MPEGGKQPDVLILEEALRIAGHRKSKFLDVKLSRAR